jgi:hypothetical protein
MRSQVDPETGIIAVSDDGEDETMRMPRTYAWGLSISKSDFKAMKKSFSASRMEERENAEVQPDESGSITLRVTRSWSGRPFLELRITQMAIESMVYESIDDGDQEITLDETKQQAVDVARYLLDCGIEAWPKRQERPFTTEDLSDLDLKRDTEDYDYYGPSKYNHHVPTDYSKHGVGDPADGTSYINCQRHRCDDPDI